MFYKLSKFVFVRNVNNYMQIVDKRNDSELIGDYSSYLFVKHLDYQPLHIDKIVEKIISEFATHENMNYEVRGKDGTLVGQISLARIKEAMQISIFADMLPVYDVMEKPAATCLPETPLPEAYQLFADHDTEAINIVDTQGKPMGILEKYTVDHYIHTKIVELEHKLEKMG